MHDPFSIWKKSSTSDTDKCPIVSQYHRSMGNKQCPFGMRLNYLMRLVKNPDESVITVGYPRTSGVEGWSELAMSDKRRYRNYEVDFC